MSDCGSTPQSPLFEPVRNFSISSASSNGSCMPDVKLPELCRPAPCACVLAGLSLPEHGGPPPGYVATKLDDLGPRLLALCRPNPETPLPALSLPSPTSLLQVTFQDTHQTIQVPTYPLVLETRLPILAGWHIVPPARASAGAAPGSSRTTTLSFELPSAASFPALHEYLYLHQPTRLFQTLFEGPRARQERRRSLAAASLQPPGPDGPLGKLFLLDQAAVVFSLWRNVVALEMQDDALWSALQREWTRIQSEVDG